MAKLVTCWTGEDLYAAPIPFSEVKDRLSNLDLNSVLVFCSVSNVLLGFWKRHSLHRSVYKELTDRLYSPEMAVRILSGWGTKFIFSRRQLLILARLAIEHCETAPNKLKASSVEFWQHLGRILAGINDQLHFGLSGRPVPIEEKIKNLFVELTPVVEDGGVSVAAKFGRAKTMLYDLPASLEHHQDYIDLGGEFERATGIPLSFFHAICAVLFTKWTVGRIETLQARPDDLFLSREWFVNVVSKPEYIDGVLSALTWDVTDCRAAFQGRLLEDFTPFKAKPLIKLGDRYCVIDLGLVAESVEACPFWTLNRNTNADRLRRFWGALFERYVSELTDAVSNPLVNRVIVDPRFAANAEEQVCDVLCVYADTAVFIETKGVMFAADKKYSGKVDDFFGDFELKFVANQEGKKKGVSQLTSAIESIFVQGKQIRGVDLAQIRRIYPLIVSSDTIADNPLINRALNLYFPHELLQNKSGRIVLPVMGISAESYEFLTAHADTVPMAVLLNDWLSADPTLRTSYPMLSTEITALLGDSRNRLVTRTYHEFMEMVRVELFPGETELAQV